MTDSTPRLVIVSNRLPVTVKMERGDLRVTPSAGGLATGLKGPHERSSGLWIGWPGDPGAKLEPAQRDALDRRLAELRTVPVHLTQAEVARYYEGYSNGVLWPLFHYRLETIPHESRDWETYRRVNERFADVVAKAWRPGDLVWVQDYQLCLLPGLLRERLPEARIGFFLHIPFPSQEVFRTLPARDAILQGLLGADLIGFHAFSYLRHFTQSLLRVLGLEANIDRVAVDDRDVRLGVFPMGIDVAAFQELAASSDVRDESRAMRESAGGQKTLLGIDRLDYTKGIARRILAFERLLEREPQLRGRVRLVQQCVPSRTNVEAYAELRRKVDELVGRVNGAYGTVSWTPIRYLYRAMNPRHVAAFYKAADAMLVTPLRDGMNLVAKEFVAARDDEDGVLVLSEFAGAAAELGGDALLVNPYDVDRMALAYKQAITMPEDERRQRMRGLRRIVATYDVHAWAESFIADLAKTPEPQPAAHTLGVARLMMDVVAQTKRAPETVLLLDYDGTLVDFASTPERAAPDGELLALLRALVQRPRTRVAIVSGRIREPLDAWFGALPLAMFAEHGYWSKEGPGKPWIAATEAPGEWKDKARRIFADLAARTPGAFVEEKTSSLAWHYRRADPEYGAIQAQELLVHLETVFSNAPVEVIPGDKVVEIRPYGVNKAVAVRAMLRSASAEACVVALGDDLTDEDMFGALPDGAISVHVGKRRSRARYRLADAGAARAMLRAIVD
jgi:trehalose 6-phosphate synthase/phosphatase